MKPGELERIRIVTRHFADLQGLREMVPLGICLLLYGADMLTRSAFVLIVFAALLLLAGLLPALATKRFYRRRFGEVEGLGTQERWEPALAPYELARSDARKRWESALAPHGPQYFGGVEGPPQGSRYFRVVESPPGWPVVRRQADHGPLIASLLGVSGFVAAKELSQRHPAQAVEVLCIVFGAALFWRWIRLEVTAGQLYYPMLGALLLAAAAFHGAAAALVPALGQMGGGMVLVGGAWVVAGLLDHRTLEQVLRPAGMQRGLFGRARAAAEETPWEELQREETR